MKKRALALLLCLVLLLSGTALAAENSTDNFVRIKTYAGQFSDLTTESVHYGNVAALYEYGLSVGKPDGAYGMQEPMQVGEVIIFASRIRSLYQTGDAEAGAGAYLVSLSEPAYARHLAYLQAEGVIGDELDGDYGAAATRAQVAHVLANTLPAAALPAINETVVTEGYALGRYITDVTDYTPYQQDILSLYKSGVALGSDDAGSFFPEQPITRAEAAAMLTRMVDPALRVEPDWILSAVSSAAGTTLADLVPSAKFVADAETEDELRACVQYMLSRGEHSMTLRYDQPVSAAFASRIMDQSLAIVKDFCEQMYNSVSCSYTGDSVTLSFSCVGISTAELESYRNYTAQRAAAVHDELWASGQITAGMTDLEKAKVYFTWICDHCVYDYSAGDVSLSHIAYQLFKEGTAVCDGYTGAYNLFLKLEGIDCWTQFNDEHIWTVAVLDGETYHIDTTWGDAASPIQYQYFAMTPAQAWSAHRW